MSDAEFSSRAVQRGRTRITARALEKIVSAVAADAFGVEQKRVSLQIEDARGELSLWVKTPLPVPSLEEIREDPARVADGGGPVLERANRAQENIREHVHRITGSAVARVMVEITGADVTPQRRVK